MVQYATDMHQSKQPFRTHTVQCTLAVHPVQCTPDICSCFVIYRYWHLYGPLFGSGRHQDLRGQKLAVVW